MATYYICVHETVWELKGELLEYEEEDCLLWRLACFANTRLLSRKLPGNLQLDLHEHVVEEKKYIGCSCKPPCNKFEYDRDNYNRYYVDKVEIVLALQEAGIKWEDFACPECGKTGAVLLDTVKIYRRARWTLQCVACDNVFVIKKMIQEIRKMARQNERKEVSTISLEKYIQT